MNWLSKTGRELTVEAITNIVFNAMGAKLPWINIPVLSNVIKWVLGFGIDKGLEKSILIINDAIVEKKVNDDLRDFLNVYKKVRELDLKTATKEEIYAINQEQIEAARRLIRVGRSRIKL